MSRFFDHLDRMSNLMDGTDSPDIKLEDDAKWAGAKIEKPDWFYFIIRRLRLIGVGLSVLIIGLIFLFTRSTAYASVDGIKAMMYLLIPALGLILMPAYAIAVIQKRVNFRNTLPVNQREIYDKAVKKRVKDFVVLLSVSLVVTVVLVAILVYANNKG